MDKKSEITLSGFIKIGQKDHIGTLQKEGLLYCNTVEYFRKFENTDRNRRDEREGALSSQRITSMEIFDLKGNKLPLIFRKGVFNPYDENLNQTHLFCLYMITPASATGESFVDEENIKFGDAALLIFDPAEFLKRLNIEIKDKHNLSYGPVSYYSEEDDHLRLTIFDKPERFKHQNEFRIHILTKSPDPLLLKIGSIEDISIILDAKDLVKLNLRPE